VALAANGAVRSAHDVSDGGIAVTLADLLRVTRRGAARCAQLGADVKLETTSSAEYALFGESGARAVSPRRQLRLPPFSRLRDNME